MTTASQANGNNFTSQFCNRLINARKALKMSQEELAEHLGISQQAVGKWERGENLPSRKMIKPLQSLFGVFWKGITYPDPAYLRAAGLHKSGAFIATLRSEELKSVPTSHAPNISQNAQDTPDNAPQGASLREIKNAIEHIRGLLEDHAVGQIAQSGEISVEDEFTRRMLRQAEQALALATLMLRNVPDEALNETPAYRRPDNWPKG